MKKLIVISIITALTAGCATSRESRSANTIRVLKAHPHCETQYPVFTTSLNDYSKADLEKMVLSRLDANKPVSKESLSKAIYPDRKHESLLLQSTAPIRLSESELSCVLADSGKLAIKYRDADIAELQRKEKEKIEKEKRRQESIANRKKWEASKEGLSTKRACLTVGQEIADKFSFDNVHVAMFTLDSNRNIAQCSVRASGEDALGMHRVRYFEFIYNLNNNMYEVYY
ncbi:TPA: hypothetical protein VGT19_005447 [Vibrio harveyi]|nr:hypothetical protein [Vibrio harveyi]